MGKKDSTGPKEPPRPNVTPPGRVSRNPGPGASEAGVLYGVGALRAKLGLSAQPSTGEVADRAVARINELEKQIAEVEPGGEKLDVKTRSAASQL